METRTAIINAVAARQRIYVAKRTEAFNRDRDEQFERMGMAVEVCSYVLADVLSALDLPMADDDADDLIEPIPTFPEHA
jgi:hypothetical protein